MLRKRKGRKVLCIGCSDIHLRDYVPVSRGETSWFPVMGRYMSQLQDLAIATGAPIVYAGDIFHTARSNVPLVNWAIDNLPPGISVPGQHDLPEHSLGQLPESAYYTLCRAGVLTHIEEPVEEGGIRLHPFGWGSKIHPLANRSKDLIEVAVVHEGWYESQVHKGVREDQVVESFAAKLKGYDFAIVGDNHDPFDMRVGKCVVMNCGQFIRTNSDQKDSPAGCFVIWDDGQWDRVWWDTSQDLWVEGASAVESQELDVVRATVRTLAEFADMSLSFRDSLSEFLTTADTAVSPLAMEYLNRLVGAM